jgi:hypothetical protein
MDDKETEKEKHDGPEHEEEEEDEEGNKRAVVLGPQVPLKEQLELDKVPALLTSFCALLTSFSGLDHLRKMISFT